jgi:L-threonylcarbamoyladenylate synthase
MNEKMNEDLIKCIEVLKKGGIILYPTDTIWGIGCDASNYNAVKRVYEIKKREDSKSMLVLVDKADRIDRYVNDVPDVAWNLVEMALEPLTIIYPDAKNLAENLIAEDGSIGIRVVTDTFCQKLIYQFRKPIVSTSANISGQASPANFIEISSEIIDSVDYVVKWRQKDTKKAKPSAIIKLDKGGLFKIIRNG